MTRGPTPARRDRRLLALLVLGATMACGGSSGSTPTAPTPLPDVPLSLTGTWTGTATDAPTGTTFGLTVTLAQSGAGITGSWTTSTGNSGSLTGQVAGSAVTLTLSNVDREPDCTARLDGQRDGEHRIAGTFVQGDDCTDGGQGTFELTRPDQTGCAGTPVGRVEINVNTAATLDVFGETFVVQSASGQNPFRITRDVVPCDYVLVGRLTTPPGPIIVEFLRTAPYEQGANPGGVDRGSIVVEVGDSQDFLTPCQVALRGAGGDAAGFRIRFRVVATNATACQ